MVRPVLRRSQCMGVGVATGIPQISPRKLAARCPRANPQKDEEPSMPNVSEVLVERLHGTKTPSSGCQPMALTASSKHYASGRTRFGSFTPGTKKLRR
jgi:hypothetical protein